MSDAIVPTVEDLVNNANFNVDPNYVPSDFALGFVNFIKLVNHPDGEENKSPVLHFKMLDRIATSQSNIVNMLFRGSAKALGIDEEVVTPTGLRKMKDLQKGDLVYDRDGFVTAITCVSKRHHNDTYRVLLEDGSDFTVNEDHLHIVIKEGGEEKVLTTKELLSTSKDYWNIPNITGPIKFEKVFTYLDPYKVGRLLRAEQGIDLLDDPEVMKLFYGSYRQRVELYGGLMVPEDTSDYSIAHRYASGTERLCRLIHGLIKGLGGYSKISVEEDGMFLVKGSLRSAYPKYTKILRITRNFNKIPSICIAVDSITKSFLTKDIIVTHNTTLFGEYLFLYLAVYGSLPNFGEVMVAMYVSDSVENGVKNMRRNIEARWENSDFLQQYVPKIKFTDIRWEFLNKSGKKLIVKGYGASTGVRGAKELGIRPQLAVLDDLVSDEDARSPAVISSIESTVYSAIIPALHPKRRKIIWSGTPFNSRDPLYKAVESGAWATNVFPICEKFPCTEEEFKGAWEDRFPYKYVKEQYDLTLKSGHIDSFNQEFKLVIMSDEERLVQDGDIFWFKRQEIIKHKDRYNFYITTDFATSEKTSADYSFISVWAYNYKGDWMLVDGSMGRRLMGTNVDELFKFVDMYQPRQVGIEISGQQKGFISWISNEMVSRNCYFSLASEGGKEGGLRPTTNKLQRFNVIIPLFKSHKIWFPEDWKTSDFMVEALDEIRLASMKGFKSKHDDFLDTVSMLGSLNPWKPAKVEVETSGGTQTEYFPGHYEDESVNDQGTNSYIV